MMSFKRNDVVDIIPAQELVLLHQAKQVYRMYKSATQQKLHDCLVAPLLLITFFLAILRAQKQYRCSSTFRLRKAWRIVSGFLCHLD